jgi:choline dehydrogenase-like flavoprotein
MSRSFDAIVIGAGQAGPFLARLGEAGMKVAIVERKLFGGTCRDPYHRPIDSAPAISSNGTWASDERIRRDAPSGVAAKPTLRTIDAGLFPNRLCSRRLR